MEQVWIVRVKMAADWPYPQGWVICGVFSSFTAADDYLDNFNIDRVLEYEVKSYEVKNKKEEENGCD